MMKRFALALVIVTLASTATFAQGRQGGGRPRGGRPSGASGAIWNGRSTLLLFDALLNLTDAQVDELTAVFNAASKTAVPLATALEAEQNALFEAVKSGQNDDELQRLAEKHGALTIQFQALQARTFARMWALLTPEQRAKVDESTYEHIGTFLANTPLYGGR